MRAVSIAFLAVTRAAIAQSSDPSEAVEQALAATSELADISAQSGNPVIAESARRAQSAVATVAEAIRASPYYQSPPLMDPVTFNTFYDELHRATNNEKRTNIARAGMRHLFTVDQVVSLMELFAMADDQIGVATTLYRRIVDPENFDKVYAALTFDTDRRRLALAVAR